MTADRSIQQAASRLDPSNGSAARANLALVLGVLSLLGSAALLLGYVFKLF